MYGSGVEWLAARSEFNLAGQQAADSVILSFKLDSVTLPSAPLGAAGYMPLRAYIGDNLAQLSDYTPAWSGDIGSVAFGTLAPGAVVSYDVTSLFNAALARGDAAFGVGIDSRVVPNSFASYSDFTLSVSAVPEPATAALLLAGLAGLALVTYRRRT